MPHLYVTFENLALSDEQRDSITSALDALGDNDNPSPAKRNHQRAVTEDCIIYEADFVESNIDEDAIDVLLATALDVDVSTVSHAVYLSDYGRTAVFEHSDILYCRVIYHDRDAVFGNHDESREQVHLYQRARDAAASATYEGVPHLVPDYDRDVGANWTFHPYNPANPYRITAIASPATTIDVEADHGGDLQAAIDAVPAGGARLTLGASYYDGEYLVEGQGNIHFIGQGQGVTRIRELRVFGDPMVGVGVYRDFIDALKRPSNPDNDAAIAFAQNVPRNFYFTDLTFDGDGQEISYVGDEPEDADNMAVHLRAVDDILFEDVTFENYSTPGTGKPHGPITAHCLVDNIWAIGCTFDTTTRSAAFVDGAHDMGFVNCTFADVYSDNYIVIFCHDDVTEDVNENGVLDPDELRPAQYVVVCRCTMTNAVGSRAIVGHMGHALIFDCDIQGQWTKPPIEIVGRSCQDELPGVYDHTDVQIANCAVGRVPGYLLKLDGQYVNDNVTPGIIGRAIVFNNAIGDATSFADWIEEYQGDNGEVVGPHTVAENTV